MRRFYPGCVCAVNRGLSLEKSRGFCYTKGIGSKGLEMQVTVRGSVFELIRKTPSAGDVLFYRNVKQGSMLPGRVTSVSASVCVLEFRRESITGEKQTWSEKAHVACLFTLVR